MTETPSPPGVVCLRCQNPTAYLGKIPVVTGGSSGAAKLLFGQLAEVSERDWFIDAYRCTYCGHLEMFDLSQVQAAQPDSA
ncbi:MAG: hypothetical protein WCB85_07920 [Candidatus Dormiibacterota bacterium]